MSKQASKFSTLKEATEFINQVDTEQIAEYHLIYENPIHRVKGYWIIKIKVLLPLAKAEWRFL